MIEAFKEILQSKELTGFQVICISVITSAITFLLAFTCKTIFKILKTLAKNIVSKLRDKWKVYKFHRNGHLTTKEMIDLQEKIDNGIILNKKELKMKIIYDKEMEELKEAMKDIDFKSISNICKPTDVTMFLNRKK